MRSRLGPGGGGRGELLPAERFDGFVLWKEGALIILLLFIVAVIIAVLLNPELLDISFPRCDFQPLFRRSC